jgi:hypothetical protein
MTLTRPNNWGSMGFGTMCAIYAYLDDTAALASLRKTWISTINGPSAESFKYGDDLWILEFIDRAYGSTFAKGKDVWGHGKNAGYPYVAQLAD